MILRIAWIARAKYNHRFDRVTRNLRRDFSSCQAKYDDRISISGRENNRPMIYRRPIVLRPMVCRNFISFTVECTYLCDLVINYRIIRILKRTVGITLLFYCLDCFRRNWLIQVCLSLDCRNLRKCLFSWIQPNEWKLNRDSFYSHILCIFVRLNLYK